MPTPKRVARLLFTIGFVAFLGVASAQFDWSTLPRDGPSIPAFLHPPSVAPGEAALVLLCEKGSFMPMLRLGQVLTGEGGGTIWVETLISEQLGAGSPWMFDPPSGRAIPWDERAAAVISQGLLSGGTLRVTARLTQESTGFNYNFGLDDYWTLRDVARCLRPSEASIHVSEYYWDPETEAVLAGVPGDKALVFYCTNQLTVGLDFHSSTDPKTAQLLIWIGANSPQTYTFERVGEGFYQGDPWAMMQVFSYMTSGNDTAYVMVGGPAPIFVTSNYPALVRAWANLPCVEGS